MAQAHVVEGSDEEDSTLLMATVKVASPSVEASPTTGQGVLVPYGVCLFEAKVTPRLDAPEDRDDSHWILDTGASNHMTGTRSLFSELNKGIGGSVLFGDGSTVAIEGRGTIVFSCKNGEQSALTGVYYIPCLTTNNISVGQMDEGGCRIDIYHGVLRIFDRQKKLLVRVKCTSGRMYQLQANVGRSACFTAHSSEDAWLWQFGKDALVTPASTTSRSWCTTRWFVDYPPSTTSIRCVACASPGNSGAPRSQIMRDVAQRTHST